MRKRTPPGALTCLAVLLLTALSAAPWSPLLVPMGVALSLCTLGLPAAFRRSQALSLSEARIGFDHILSAGLTAAGTAGLYYIIGRTPYASAMVCKVLLLGGMLLGLDLAEIHLGAKRKYALALAVDAAAAVVLLVAGFAGLPLEAALAAMTAVLLLGSFLSFVVPARRVPAASTGLLKEIPGGLFEELYYPLIVLISLLLLGLGPNDPEALDRTAVAGFGAGQLLLELYRPTFRREEEERSFARLILPVAPLVLAGIALVPGAEVLMPAVAFVALASGCAFTLFEAATLPNVVSELLLIACGVALLIRVIPEPWPLPAAALLSLLALLAQIRTIGEMLRLRRLKKRQ